MKKNNIKNIIFTAINIILLIVLLFSIWGTREIGNNIAKDNMIETDNDNVSSNIAGLTGEKQEVWVYDTSQYQAYKQFVKYIYDFPPENLDYQGKFVCDGLEYNQYGNEDIKIQVITMESYTQNHMQGKVDYKVIYRDKSYTFKEDLTQYPEGLVIYYVDINKDKTKDLIIKGEPNSGTSSAYYWMRAIDLIYMEEINIFENDNHDGTIRLTSDQIDTLNIMLEEDIEFNQTFPDFQWFGNYANTLVDYYGNIYYEVGLGKGIAHDIGKILILLDYNKLTKKYDPVDYIYMPNYVSKVN